MTVQDHSLEGVAHRVEIADIDLAADLDQRRRRAVGVAVERAVDDGGGVWAADDPSSWGPSAGVCRYGPGCVVLALAGWCDRAGLESLRTLVTDLDRLVDTELVIDLSQLRGTEPALGELVGRLRGRRLAVGVRVDVRDAPPELAAELADQWTARATVSS